MVSPFSRFLFQSLPQVGDKKVQFVHVCSVHTDDTRVTSNSAEKMKRSIDLHVFIELMKHFVFFDKTRHFI